MMEQLWLFLCVIMRIPITLLSMQSNPVKRTNRMLNVEFTQITSPLERIKCYCLSDLHADTERNQQWVREKCLRKSEDQDSFTVFLLPGDVGSEMDRLESVFRHLTANYDAVVYVPGNHEAWRRGIAAGGSATRPEERADNRMAENSIIKLQEVLDCARASGVYVGPLRIQLDRAPATTAPTASVSASASTSVSASASVSSPVSASAVPTAAPADTGAGTVIFPLYSWYHSGWDKEPELVHPDFLAVEAVMPFARKWGDFAMCSWPEDLVSQSEFSSTTEDNTALARAFADINEPFLLPLEAVADGTSSSSGSGSSSGGSSKSHSGTSSSTVTASSSSSSSSRRNTAHESPIVQEGDSVISFSHFLPRQELCPEKRFLLEPLLTKVVGSDYLEGQVRRLRPHLHMFGHTHIPIDLTLEGIRYIQWPLGYTREADKQCAPVHLTGPLLIFDSALGRGTAGIPRAIPSLESIWTAHYRSNGRDAQNVYDLAPWVLRRLDAFGGFVRSHQKREDEANAERIRRVGVGMGMVQTSVVSSSVASGVASGVTTDLMVDDASRSGLTEGGVLAARAAGRTQGMAEGLATGLAEGGLITEEDATEELESPVDQYRG